MNRNPNLFLNGSMRYNPRHECEPEDVGLPD